MAASIAVDAPTDSDDSSSTSSDDAPHVPQNQPQTVVPSSTEQPPQPGAVDETPLLPITSTNSTTPQEVASKASTEKVEEAKTEAPNPE